MCSTNFPNPCNLVPRRTCTKSSTLPRGKKRTRRLTHFNRHTGTSIPRPRNAFWTAATNRWSFLISPPLTGKHLRTTNPIESTFATVRLRTRATKGPGSRSAGLAMVYRLLLTAQMTWRKLSSPELLTLVRNGVPFVDGECAERTDDYESAKQEEERLRRKSRRLIRNRSTTFGDTSPPLSGSDDNPHVPRDFAYVGQMAQQIMRPHNCNTKCMEWSHL